MHVKKAGLCGKIMTTTIKQSVYNNVIIKFTAGFEFEGFSSFPDYCMSQSLPWKYLWQCL